MTIRFGDLHSMSLIRIATALAATAMVSPAFAADVSESSPVDHWEFYIGAHAGVVWGDGEWVDETDAHVDLDGSRGIFGVLAGANYRMDTLFIGLEGDVGFATGDFDWEGVESGFFDNDHSGCSNGAWCDVNGHIRLRAGIAALDGLDLFVAGGLALADGDGDDDDAVLDEANHDMFIGWSIGGGADLALSEHLKLRIEYLHDDYGNRHPFPSDSDYNSDWADDTVRGAAIFTF